jgi:hypothetical protein
MKKKVGLIFIVLLFVSLFSVMVAAQNISEFDNCDDYCDAFWMSAMPACPGEQATTGISPDCECGWECFEEEERENESDELYEGYENETLKEKAGSKPGDLFYFIDRFFDRFGDELSVKEERIAEIKELLEAGDIEGAKVALRDYMELAKELEHEIDPERREEAKRSAAAIRNAMKDIRDGLPPGERGKFVSDIMSSEHRIATAAEIAGKIKELCTQLSELDPFEYSKMCRTGDDSPKWQKRLDRDLSEEQEEIAKEFVGIMKDCFKTSGQDCRCEDIPFPDFADACSEAAPLATACDVDGDERACEKLDELEMPELPDWLQDIWEDLEEGMNEAQYDMHMPRECVEAGVTNPKECGRVMIETNAPEECKQPLLDSGCDSERECREICEKIMMEVHAPECVEEGITDPKECQDFMFSIDRRPRECQENQIHDIRDCKRFMEEGGQRRPGPGIDFNCQEIEDPMERLDCFDKASSQMKGSYGGFGEDYEGNCMTQDDWDAKKRECREMYGENAGDEPIYGDSGSGYQCTVDAKCIDFSQGKLDFEEIKERERKCARDCEEQGKAWDFSYGECKCYGGDYEEGPTSDEKSCDDCASQCEDISGQRLRATECGDNGCECYYESDEPEYGPGEGPGEPSDYEEEDSSDGGEPEEEEPSDSAPEGDNTITGEVVGNEFLNYYLE